MEILSTHPNKLIMKNRNKLEIKIQWENGIKGEKSKNKRCILEKIKRLEVLKL